MLTVHALPRLPSLPLLLLASLPALLPWRGRALWAVTILGVLLSVLQAERHLAERWPASRHGEEIALRGRVASLPQLRATQDGSVWRFELEPLEAREVPPRIRVAWYRSDAVIKGGECWRLRLRLRTPRGSLNPGGFDYEGWLWRENIGATATVRDAERCDEPLSRGWLPLRQRIVDDLAAWLPGHPGVPLVAALTVGDDSQLSDRDWQALRATGTSHLIAISGFNVAIIATFAFFLVRWFWAALPALCLRWPAQKAGWAAAALFGTLYALLAGWDAPVARAAWMLLALSAAALSDRLGSPSRVLALVWLLMLVLDPAAVLSPGLWLSFGAVALIFYLAAGRLARPPAWRQGLVLQLALSMAIAPLTLFFFGAVAWLSAPVNLVAVPVAGVLTPLLMIALGLALIWPAAGIPALGLCASALDRLREGLVALAGLAQGEWTPATPSLATLLLAGFGLALLFAPRGLPLRALGLLCLLPLLQPPPALDDGDLEVAVLDVGQGLAVVARTARHALVYDAGPSFDAGFDAGETVVAPYLLAQGIRKPSLLMISHDDRDHVGGAPALRRRLNFAGETGATTPRPCRDGERWAWDGVRFELLHPDGSAWSDNDSSCVLRIDGPFSVLLTGDISEAAERRLVVAHADRLRADLLLAPHHGSKTSSSAAFVAAVAPQAVAFSAAWRSHYGHPAALVVERYRAAGATPYSTALSGALRFRRGDEGLEVQQWRQNAAHYWNAPAAALE